MITVYYWDNTKKLVIDGHADGSPEVCAVVSALTQSMTEYLRQNRKNIIKAATVGRGHFEFEGELDTMGAYILNYVAYTLESLAAEHGKYIKFVGMDDL